MIIAKFIVVKPVTPSSFRNFTMASHPIQLMNYYDSGSNAFEAAYEIRAQSKSRDYHYAKPIVQRLSD